jgi:UDP-N-acetylmuramyl pentapeptide synthase
VNNIEVTDILKATNGKLLLGSPESRVTGISTDSRSIKEGEIMELPVR